MAIENKEITLATFKTALDKYDRETVLEGLKANIMDEAKDEEKKELYTKITRLRDMKIFEQLAKDDAKLPLELLTVDYSNVNNQNFLKSVLKKYGQKFPVDTEEEIESVFHAACRVDAKSVVEELMKGNKAEKNYDMMVNASDDIFNLLKKTSPTSLKEDTVVDILFAAACCDKCADRVTALQEAGYSLDTKNAEGETALDLLRSKIRRSKYEKNRAGELKKQRDKDTLRVLELKGSLKEKREKPSKGISKRVWISSAAAVAVVAILCVVFYFLTQNDAKASATDTTTTDTTTTDSTVATDTNAADVAYNSDTALVVEDGDSVNIDYVGYVDGVAFDGGNTNGTGTQLLIGSNSYIDDFEAQLVGHHVGDNVEVNVTFPDDYQSADLAGKDATFDVTINGIYE